MIACTTNSVRTYTRDLLLCTAAAPAAGMNLLRSRHQYIIWYPRAVVQALLLLVLFDLSI